MSAYPGPFCSSIGVTCEQLTSFDLKEVEEEKITNGLVTELYKFFEGRVKDIQKSLTLLCPKFEQAHSRTVHTKIVRTREVKRKLQIKNKVKGYRSVADFLSCVFGIPTKKPKPAICYSEVESADASFCETTEPATNVEIAEPDTNVDIPSSATDNCEISNLLDNGKAQLEYLSDIYQFIPIIFMTY